MKKFFLIALAVVLVLSMASCSNPEGLNMGFKGKWIGTLPDVHFGIQSDKTEFDISNVTLDFSYGTGDSRDVGGYVGGDNSEDCPIVCIAVYFFNAKSAGCNGLRTIFS